jgi:hypothetical protein
MFRGPAWLLWFALLVLPLAQSFAAWHVYSHDTAAINAARDAHGKQAAHQAQCDICLAAAAINGAPSGDALPPLPLAAHDTPPPSRELVLWLAPPERLYASRAPPLLLS